MKSTALVLYHGEEIAAGELVRQKNLALSTFSHRVEVLGWSIDKAADTQPDKRFRKGGRRKAGSVRPCPELREHPDGRAFCRWREGTKRPSRYFGQWGTDESRRAYERFRLEWAGANGAPPLTGRRVYVAGLIRHFKAWAKGHYIKDGKPTSELSIYKTACEALNELYGAYEVDDFRPAHLIALRQSLVDRGFTRSGCNRYTAKVVRVFAWGVAAAHGLVHPDTAARLKAVEALASGRTTAPDREPVPPADPAHVEQTIPHLHTDPARQRVLEAMIRTLLVTGMRPGEVCALEPEHMDRSKRTWRYEVVRANKNRHKGKRRVVFIGARGRAVLGPFLDAAQPGRRVFGWPFRASADGDRWTAVSRLELARFVRKACKAAGVPHWHPNQIRHTHATEIHDRYESDEAAAAVLGNSPEVARQVYINSPEERVAMRIAEELG